MAVDLHPTHKKTDLHEAHEALLTCFLPHELLLACSTRNLTCVRPILYHKHVLIRVTTKIEEHTRVYHTRVSTRREQYCMYVGIP